MDNSIEPLMPHAMQNYQNLENNLNLILQQPESSSRNHVA